MMARMTPEQEAEYALAYGSREDLSSDEARAVYDRLFREGPQPDPAAPVPEVPARSTPETRARILHMFKRMNSKYAKPFEKDRLAVLSIMGGDWEQYGQIVLQMAILDTLLSIEEMLGEGRQGERNA